MATLITYNTANFTWDNNVHLWNLCQRVLGGKSKAKRDEERKQWEKDKKKVIKLVMWRKGIKVYDEEKEVENIELYIDDIELIAEEIKRNVQIIY